MLIGRQRFRVVLCPFEVQRQSIVLLLMSVLFAFLQHPAVLSYGLSSLCFRVSPAASEVRRQFLRISGFEGTPFCVQSHFVSNLISGEFRGFLNMGPQFCGGFPAPRQAPSWEDGHGAKPRCKLDPGCPYAGPEERLVSLLVVPLVLWPPKT